MARKKGAVAKSAGEWCDTFIEALRTIPVVRLACERAGISRKTAYQWRERDENFRQRWDEALADGIDVLEAQAHARARNGSDRLLEFLLKNLRRRVYGDKVGVDVSGSLTVEEVDRAKASLDDKLGRIEEAIAKANK
jgi:hypothetical protein|tara:strand:- start:924 stop:1334 length:411 start_codon:yes stop_codon:yes gene_type:complete